MLIPDNGTITEHMTPSKLLSHTEACTISTVRWMNLRLAAEFDEKRETVAALCEKYGVAYLDLFGSGTTDDWRPLDSDLDFVVAFRSDSTGRLATRYLGLAEDLEALFGRSVDLITPASIQNPYFRARVDASRSRVYAE